MIAARYLPNATLPESLFSEVAIRVKKYLAIKKANLGSDKHERWVLGIIAAEIEALLNDHSQETAFIHFLYEQIADRVTLRGWDMNDEARRLQIYIAIVRCLTKADEEMLAFKLVRSFQLAWTQPETWLHDPHAMATSMVQANRDIQTTLNHPLSQKFVQAIKPWAISLTILRDSLGEHPQDAAKLLDHPEELYDGRSIAERRYKESRTNFVEERCAPSFICL